MGGATVASVIVLFFLPLGVIGNAVGQPNVTGNAVGQPNHNYDYMQFVQQYTKTLNVSSEYTERFTIHGLWPNNSFGYGSDLPCQTPYANRYQLSGQLTNELRNTLSYSWPNVYYYWHVTKFQNNLIFWYNEYQKHGSCAVALLGIFPTAQAYFERAHKLWEANDLYGVFVNYNIHPGDRVDARKFRTALRIATGWNARLSCTGTGLLMEVVICYDIHATRVRNCPRPGNCTGLIISYPK